MRFALAAAIAMLSTTVTVEYPWWILIMHPCNGQQQCNNYANSSIGCGTGSGSVGILSGDKCQAFCYKGLNQQMTPGPMFHCPARDDAITQNYGRD